MPLTNSRAISIGQNTTVHAYLRCFPLFSSLKDEVIGDLAHHAQVRAEKKGAVIFSPETANDKFYLVVSGWVKLFKQTMAGDEAVIDVLTSGHVFGEIGLTGAETVSYGAEVVEDAEVISLPRFLLAQEVLRNGIFGLDILKNMTKQKNSRDSEIEHRTVQSAPQRIGCFLLKFCASKVSGAITLHLPYDKTIVAHRLGMQPETFSRALTKLREETGIRVKGSTLEIESIEKLVQYTCSACSSSFPCKEH